jgi:nucleoside-diphosphate-sugar epimerase
MKDKILVIGAAGQIGSELTTELAYYYGSENVIAADIREVPKNVSDVVRSEFIDVNELGPLTELVKSANINQIYLLAARLSASAELNPRESWQLNINSLLMVLDMAKEGMIRKIFWPSSIAVFGPSTPKVNTPQFTVTEPITVYGISKLAGERWCEYYFLKYGVDVRSIRYPGLISYMTKAGGGTTDYAVDIFYEAVIHKRYQCFLKPDTMLPMMFMPDAIKGTIALMEAPRDRITVASSYNLAAMSFTPAQLAQEIKKHLPEFTIEYEPDFRQGIAESWPSSIDDSFARRDWGWCPEYDLVKMTSVMLDEISARV